MKVKILMADNDKYFTVGLRFLLSDYFKEKAISVEFNEAINPNTHYFMAFVCTEKLAQYRYVKATINADTVFMIQSDSGAMRENCDEKMESIQRHHSASAILSQIDAAYSPPAVRPYVESTMVLTQREKTVLAYYSNGYTNVQIGRLLGINQKTVSAHKVKAMTKFNFKHKGDFRCWLIANSNCEE
ncbi:LuxR C-terminal-related transcriptional regulator [Serratia sp. D1N4]